ncbi:hypothetical protein CACET_c20200 [Clostridium aceticum]|uniref:Uncharacterized protein n=1 Tax=Clostridium aceticum TaxID=84022 RepID=A0A0D8I6U7_9CLOT|nr:hypothetical protein [Clostridium aceticum]AKL95468.1 hypothetical protein CACET_c20200 [Clostridium aceticum]KJF25953.1 hypothetical protein TZ02_15685 [Clostridium aceticum]
MINTIYTFFAISTIAVFVIFLAYYTTAFIGKKSSLYFEGRTAKVLERTILSTNLSLTIVQVIDKVYILVLYNKSVEVLDILSIEEWNVFKKSQNQTPQNNIQFLKSPSYFTGKIKEKLAVMVERNNKKGDRK